MQNPVFKKMYMDYGVIQDIKESLFCLKMTDIDEAIVKWDTASKKIESIIPKIAEINMETAKFLLENWGKALNEKDDFRVLSYHLEQELLHALLMSLNTLYGPIDLDGGSYSFHKTESGFMNVRDNNICRYIHDLSDPMYEASVLAKDLYSPGMYNFHILGCGLGYLAYQIWERSERTAHIYMYEDDKSMLEFADQIGVLSWIDKECLTLVDNSNTEKLIAEFYKACETDIPNRYISDWKVGSYNRITNGYLIDSLDFNERNRRFSGNRNLINSYENRKQTLYEFESIRKQINKQTKDAIVVSAGPSLNDNIEFIRSNADSKLIICINAALKKLQCEKICPDVVVALDPKKTLSSHIEGIENFTDGIPLVITDNASYTFVKKYRGPKYVVSNYDRTSDGFVWNFGGTVASFALDLAYYLGAENIYLVGSDLAFSENRNYADGVAHEINEGMLNSVTVESTDGGMVGTTRLYNKYREILEAQISKHPDSRVYNMAHHGAKIKGTYSGDEKR